MSSNNENIGNQEMTWEYQQEARAKLFNQSFCDIIPYGIYAGGGLARLNDSQILVKPLVCMIKSDENDKVALRIETSSDVVLNVPPNRPYIVLRFGWHDLSTNYMNILAVNPNFEINNIPPLQQRDIIVGKVIFNGSNIAGSSSALNSKDSFDFSKRNNAFIKDLENLYNQFLVSPTEPYSDCVNVSAGTLKTSKGWKLINGAILPIEALENSLPRKDLVIVTDDHRIDIIKGTPSFNANAPLYKNYTVLAEVLRRPDSDVITGGDIQRIIHNTTILGTIAAEDFPVKLTNFTEIPSNMKNIESILDYLLQRNLTASPNNSVNDSSILCRHINFGVSNENQINASHIPVVDAAGNFSAFPKTVEKVLAELNTDVGILDQGLNSLNQEKISKDQQATSTTLGLVKLASNTIQSTAEQAVSTVPERTFKVQANSSGQLVINVPGAENKKLVDSLFLNSQGSTSPESGLYSIINGTAMGLSNHYWHIIQLKHGSDGYNAQIAVTLNTETIVKVRTSAGTVWRDWQTFIRTSYTNGNTLTLFI